MPSTASFLERDAVWHRITALAARPRRGPAWVAAAYVGGAAPDLLPLRRGDTLIVDASDAALRAGVTNPSSLRQYLRAGVAIYTRSGLHAKVYVFGRTAIIGSANASRASASNLVEAAVSSTDPAVVHDAIDFVRGLTAEWAAIDERRVERMSTIYRPPRFRPASVEQSTLWPSDPPAPRMRVVMMGRHEFSADESRAESRTSTEVQQQARSLGRLRTEAIAWDRAPEFSEEDFVIQVWAPRDSERSWRVYPPARVLRIVPTRRTSIVWLGSSTPTHTKTWPEFRAFCEQAGIRFVEGFPSDVWIRPVTARQFIVSSWGQAT